MEMNAICPRTHESKEYIAPRSDSSLKLLKVRRATQRHKQAKINIQYSKNNTLLNDRNI